MSELNRVIERVSDVAPLIYGEQLHSDVMTLVKAVAELKAERDRMAELVKAVHTDSIKRADTGGVQIYISNGTWIDIKKVAGEESK